MFLHQALTLWCECFSMGFTTGLQLTTKVFHGAAGFGRLLWWVSVVFLSGKSVWNHETIRSFEYTYEKQLISIALKMFSFKSESALETGVNERFNTSTSTSTPTLSTAQRPRNLAGASANILGHSLIASPSPPIFFVQSPVPADELPIHLRFVWTQSRHNPCNRFPRGFLSKHKSRQRHANWHTVWFHQKNLSHLIVAVCQHRQPTHMWVHVIMWSDQPKPYGGICTDGTTARHVFFFFSNGSMPGSRGGRTWDKGFWRFLSFPPFPP